MLLELKGLSAGYGPFTATHDIDLGIPEGSVVALLGANGAGKTSTIMSIAGHVEAKSGAILLEGRDITALPPYERVRQGIALAPEGRRLFGDLSVAENLMVGGYSRPKSEEAEAREKVLTLFPRLRERLNQRAGTMSGGEQQMLAIGRALMAKPKLLMIDEVSLGLMPKAVDICYEAIAELKKQGLTVLIVEQSTSRALDIADAVCVLESGRVVWKGDAASAKNDPAMIEAFMGLKEEA